MSQPVVQAIGVSKVFGTGDAEVRALDDISIEIEPGEFISLIGPSGCGKSTLLRLIGDLLTPTAGSLVVNGKSPAQARTDREYGIVFQSATLLDWRSVAKNVELPLEIMGVDDRSDAASQMLDLVQLSEFSDHYPWQLSGGMQFGALDEMTRKLMQQEVLRIWRETDTTVIFVTHSIPEAVFLSNRVVVMSPRPGRVSDVIETDLPHPRDEDTRESQLYYDKITEVREALRRQEAGE